MEAFWTSSIIILALSNVVFFILLIAFARELGALLVRIGPTYAKELAEGPAIGETVEPFQLTDIHGLTHDITATKYLQKMLVFTAPKCPSCFRLLPGLQTFAKAYRSDLAVFLISSGKGDTADREVAQQVGRFATYVCDRQLHERFLIHGTPYAILLDHDNIVKAKGIANNLQHLESLLSLQVYSHQNGSHEHTPAEKASVKREGT